MQLIIDVGNTKIKLAIFDKDAIVKTYTIALQEINKTIEEIALEFPVKKSQNSRSF